jgi:hypothetical protein
VFWRTLFDAPASKNDTKVRARTFLTKKSERHLETQKYENGQKQRFSLHKNDLYFDK